MAAARRFSKSVIDWAAFAARVPEEQQTQFKAFKTRHDAYVGKVMSFPEEPPKIDWDFYASKVPVPGLVDQFKQAFAQVKVAYPQDSLTKEIDAQEQKAIEDTRSFIQDSVKKIEQLKLDLNRWEDMLPVHKMTREEFVLTFPEHAFGYDQKKYQTLWPHDYNPKYGIPGEIGSGHWNIGPERHKELPSTGHH